MKLKTTKLDRDYCFLTTDTFSLKCRNHLVFVILYFVFIAGCFYQVLLMKEYLYLIGIFCLVAMSPNPFSLKINYTIGFSKPINFSFSIPLLFSRLFFVDGKIFMPENRTLSKQVHLKLNTFKDLSNG